jgi:phosphoribosyl 1,2-cyclic phosphate phosphodiesterase
VQGQGAGCGVKLTFLGTGTSFGVPQLGCHCDVCKSPDPRDKRTRVGAVVESKGGTRILIDTPPELRLQLIAAGIDRVDAVLFTHEHADHTHGIDDLRAISVRQNGALPFYGSRETLDSLKAKFGYILDSSIRPLPGTYKPEGSAHEVIAGQPFTVGDISVTPVRVPHAPRTDVLGFRMGQLGYITDAKSVPDDVIATLRGVQVLVLNALFRTEHPTHMSIPEAAEVARKVGAARTYLTHLTHDNFHADLEAELLSSGITPAFDGLTVRID